MDEYEYITDQVYTTETNNHRQDEVVLLEDAYQSGIARIDLIEQAEKTIEIAYYTLHKGSVTNTFLGLLLDAADRGVQVQVLLDGIFHNLRGELKHTIYSFVNHPNIELKFYEPLHLLKPWSWNNRLHDKLIVIDDKYAIIGGRNIGNKYFVKENEQAFVEDRDVLVINPNSNSKSVLYDMKKYFQELWNHDFTKKPIKKLTRRQQKKAQMKREQLLEELNQRKLTHAHIFNHSIDWNSLSIPTKQVIFIHNPIQRLNKEPWVWLEINNLMKTAENSVVIESPYIIPTKRMMKYTDQISLPKENITIITNSLASTPNPLAFSGYLQHAEKIIEKGLNLQEYVGPNSIHGKTYLIDDRISVIGSFNFDARSTFLSTESMVVIESEEFANHLYENVEDRVKQQTVIQTNENTEKETVSFMKKVLLRILSKITLFYQHML